MRQIRNIFGLTSNDFSPTSNGTVMPKLVLQTARHFGVLYCLLKIVWFCEHKDNLILFFCCYVIL